MRLSTMPGRGLGNIQYITVRLLLPCNKLPQLQKFKITHVYFLKSSMGQESGVFPLRPLLRASQCWGPQRQASVPLAGSVSPQRGARGSDPRSASSQPGGFSAAKGAPGLVMGPPASALRAGSLPLRTPRAAAVPSSPPTPPLSGEPVPLPDKVQASQEKLFF